MDNNKRLFVGNLPYSIADEELAEMFAPFGTVESANIIVDRYSNRSKGFGFVEMSTAEEAKAAIDKLNESTVADRQIVVNVAKPREERS